MSDVSVITLVKNRSAHLERLLGGIRASAISPREVVIVDMGDEPVTPQPLDLPTTVVAMRSAGLPLAAARNRGAAQATSPHLLFLDVDCIPRQNLIAAIDRSLADRDHLVCADIRYLGPNAANIVDENDLLTAALKHPHRSFPDHGTRREENAGLFWSLLFGIRRESFVQLGGFDEGFSGYGAEDTDFGFRARDAGLPLTFMGGTGAFHQYHGVIDPPLQHIADIVPNANRFFARWNIWPMRDWLQAFAKLGLVEFQGDRITLLRLPTAAEIDAATQPPTRYF